MVYTSNLTTGEQLQIENQGTQTIIILSKGGLNQQQSQRSSFQTGSWLQAPTLFRTTTAVVLPLQRVTAVESSQNEIPPMQPMKPMQMENMRMKPMQMRMGNMQMQIGETESTSSGNRFCSQCGGEVKQNERFCSHCGEKLSYGIT